MSKETLTIDQVEEIYQLIKYAFYLLDVGYYFFDEEEMMSSIVFNMMKKYFKKI